MYIYAILMYIVQWVAGGATLIFVAQFLAQLTGGVALSKDADSTT